ncbi:protein FAM186A [Nycticebus coucang]|uniref:protein FAM186A n=1 Tax=Nycticebus coucang TaxID=9470 RepID=UPI00234D1462|nr:protein FAM186A [Nycticebus coucang]
MLINMETEIEDESESEKEDKDSIIMRNPRKVVNFTEVPALDVSFSVKSIISKIEQAQLRRAREDIDTRLKEIMENVNNIIIRYAVDLNVSMGRRSSLTEYKKRKRISFLEKMASYARNAEIREKILARILSWLEEWNAILSEMTVIDTDEYHRRIVQMEMLPETLKAIENNVKILSRFSLALLEEKKKRKKKTISRGTLWKTWKERVIKRPATAHALRADQLISDQFATNTKVSEIQDMLQELIDTAMFNKLENSAIKYVSSTILNLSKALSMVNDELKAINIPSYNIHVDDSTDKEKELAVKIIEDLTEENETLQQKLQEVEEKCEQLLRMKAVTEHQVYTSLTLKMLPGSSSQSSNAIMKGSDIDDEMERILAKEFGDAIDEVPSKGIKGPGKKWGPTILQTSQSEMISDLPEQQQHLPEKKRKKAPEDSSEDIIKDNIPLKKGDVFQTDGNDKYQSQNRKHAKDLHGYDTSRSNLSYNKSEQFSETQTLERKKNEMKSFSEAKSKLLPQAQSQHFLSTETKNQGDKSRTITTREKIEKVKQEYSLLKSPISSESKAQPTTESTDKEGKSEVSGQVEPHSMTQSDSEPQKEKTKGKNHQISSGTTTSKEFTRAQEIQDDKSEHSNLEEFQKAIMTYLKEKIENIGKPFDQKTMPKEEALLKRAEAEKLESVKAKMEEYFQTVGETVTKFLRKYNDIKKEENIGKKPMEQKKIVSFMAGSQFQKSPINAQSESSKFLSRESTDPVINNLTQMIIAEIESERDVPAVSLEEKDHKKEKQSQEQYLQVGQEKRSGISLKQQLLGEINLSSKNYEKIYNNVEGEKSRRQMKGGKQRQQKQEKVGKKEQRQNIQKQTEQEGKQKQRGKEEEEHQKLRREYIEVREQKMKGQDMLLGKEKGEMSHFQKEVGHLGLKKSWAKEQEKQRTMRVTEDLERQRQNEEKDHMKTEEEKPEELLQKISQSPGTMSSTQKRLLKDEPKLHEEKDIDRNLRTTETLHDGKYSTPVTSPASRQTTTPEGLPISGQHPTQGITLTPQQAQDLGITLTPQQAQGQGITLTPQQAKDLGITLTPQQAQGQGITLTPQQAQGQGITLTPQQAQGQGITLTPQQAQGQGITLTPQQAQGQGITLTPQQAQGQGITLTPQQAQDRGITLTPQQIQDLGITLTPQQAQGQGITLTPQQAQGQGITLTPQQAQDLGIPLIPQQAQDLGITLTPQQVQAQGVPLTPQQAQAQGVPLTPQQAQDLGIPLTPQQAQDLGIPLTPQQAQDLGIPLIPQQAQDLGIPLIPQQAQDLGITLTPQQVQAQGVTLTPQQAQDLGIPLTPQQAQDLGIPLTPQQAQDLGIPLTPQQAQDLGIPLIPQQAQDLGITLTPQQVQDLGIPLTPQQAQDLGITLTPQQAQAQGITLTPQQAQDLGIPLTPQQAQAQGVTLTPQQAQAQGVTLTPQQAQDLGIPLIPQQAQDLGITLTPQQVQAQGVTLTPQQAQDLGIPLTPQQAQDLGIPLTPQQAQDLGITLTPQQVQAQGVTLTPRQAQDLGITLTPQQAQAQGITLTPQEAQAQGITLTPQQAQDLGITLTPQQAQDLGITLTPQQAQDLGITFTPQQAQAQGITLTPQQAQDLGITFTPQQAQVQGITLTPQQTQDLVLTPQTQATPLTLERAQVLGFPLTLEEAHTLDIPFTPEKVQPFNPSAFRPFQELMPSLVTGQSIKSRLFSRPRQFLGSTASIAEESFTPEVSSTPLEILRPPLTQRPFIPRKCIEMESLSDPQKLLEPQTPTSKSRQILVYRGRSTPEKFLVPEVPSTYGQLLISGAPPAPRQPLISAVPRTVGQIPSLWTPFSPGQPLVPRTSSIPEQPLESEALISEWPQAFQPPVTPEQSPYLQASSTLGQHQTLWTRPEQASPLWMSSISKHPPTTWVPPTPGKPQKGLSSSIPKRRLTVISSLKSKSSLIYPSAPDFKVTQAPFATKKVQISEDSDTYEETQIPHDTFAIEPLKTFQSYLTSYRTPAAQTPYIDKGITPTLTKPIKSLPSLTSQLLKTSQISPSERAQKSRFPSVDKTRILTSDTKKPEIIVPPSSPQETEEKRYFVDVEAQRKNLILLNQATKMFRLPSQLYTTAKSLITETLRMDTVRLGYLFRKYIAYRLVQSARNNLTKQLKAIQNTGKGYETQNLYLMLSRIDDYRKKVMSIWTEKQTALEQKRNLYLREMIHLFGQFQEMYGLDLKQPIRLINKKQIPMSTQYVQQPFLQLQKEEDRKPDIFKKFRQQEEQMEAIWNIDLSISSYPITEKTSMHSLWAQLGGYPDIPRLLQLDIQSTFRKSLASIQSHSHKELTVSGFKGNDEDIFTTSDSEQEEFGEVEQEIICSKEESEEEDDNNGEEEMQNMEPKRRRPCPLVKIG